MNSLATSLRISYLATATLVFAALSMIGANSHAPKRLRENIDDSRKFSLGGNTHPASARAMARDEGEISASQILPQMAIHFAMTQAQNADLANLLTQLQDRKSPQFHKFLTPEEYANRFGMNLADLEKVKLWLETAGFSNVETARSRTWMSFSGTAAQAQRAFQSPIHRYIQGGEQRYANINDPQLPAALQGMVESVSGLHNFDPKALIEQPAFTSSISGNHYLTPDDFATIYNVKPLYGQGLDGSGVKIAILGRSTINLADIRAFRTASGLPVKDPTVVVGTTQPGASAADEEEADLDLEWAGGIAKNAEILYVTSASITDSLRYTINNNLAAVISISYGLCEASVSSAQYTTLNSLYSQANALGMTVVASSGDIGATACETRATPQPPATNGLGVNYLASPPGVTGVGGTRFDDSVGNYWNTANNSSNGSAVSYIPEIAWNDSNGHSSGGGASRLTAKPSWQIGPSVPVDGARDVPDVALSASPSHVGYLFCNAGSCVSGFRDASSNLSVIGGTSAGAPSFAGILALLVQKQGGRLGNVNPNLYSLGDISATAFHDVTSGNNVVTCQIGTKDCTNGQLGYSAGTGYDQVTGLGSIDANNLIQEWSGDYQVTASPATLSVARGASGNATVSVRATSNFRGTVAFKCSAASPLTNVTCSIPGTVATSGSTTMTITAGGTASGPPFPIFPRLPPQAFGVLMLVAALCAVTVFLLKRRPWAVVCLAVTVACVLGAIGCGKGSGSGSPPPPVAQTGVVTVTATSGALSNTATITVTVQ